ncbi:MAG: hypothetical protein U9N85_02225 [Bacteroidota bacterium]|nr:hypothetical protein [Bacteroidota bacterium]
MTNNKTNEKFKTFWTNTSSNELIKNEIKKKDTNNIRQEILKLINNEIKSAFAQINRNKYYKELIDNKIEDKNIVKVPIVFAGKQPYITTIRKY